MPEKEGEKMEKILAWFVFIAVACLVNPATLVA
jgi:hypothetical protein